MTPTGRQVADNTGSDLASGQVDDGAIVSVGAGEVTLVPTAAADLCQPELPAGWSLHSYADGATAGRDGQGLALSGTRVGTDSLYLGNRSLEFRATFAPRPDQHVGFGIDFLSVPWVTFSTKWGRRLYARTHFVVAEDKRLGGDWLGDSHQFRIAWRVLDVVFEIDGERVAKLLVPMPPLMRPLAANQRTAGAPLHVEWMRMSPYPPSGRFTSRVLDAERPVHWTDASWVSTVPDATTLGVELRTGPTPVPGAKWTPWRRLAAPGAPVAAESRYLQYRAVLATDDPSCTPALRSFTARFEPVPT